MLNKEIYFVAEQLVGLRQATDRKLKANVAFTLARNLKTLMPIAEDYEMERNALFAREGRRNPDNPAQIIIPPEKMDAAKEQLDKLDNIDIKVDLIKIKMEDIKDLDLSLQEAEALEYMIEEE